MAFTHTANQSVTTPAGSISGSISVESDEEIHIDTTLTASQADKEVALAVPTALLKSLAIYSDKALIVETNSSSAPDTTLTLVANEPFVWNSSMLFANPIAAANVTKIYLTNGAAATATVQIRVLRDGTP